ncbi:LPS O-antigen length regulator [Marinobacterium sp. xm-d-420]|jgi:uncharacterized protein involved in exopolysaccharide biosynthesis|uniref:Wzz/FepE/Etk N-terminal domain-containing protein n=1 Tax=Marinobacterium sp. xm-d-420 TaxID=2497737 RepID=UPI001569589C|nr:Wzz/FepE/Etk N-terminal domain-containing protein [Marinobacterium sp. xm-d-420]NRP26551.1 LPS O-antigen length regulator [Marinobacterium sp. xm-d-420]
MNQVEQQAATLADDEIDLRELFGVLWRGKWLIVLSTILAGTIAVLVALTMPNIYRSEALLAPVSADGGAGALASKYGALAGLAGISLPSGGADKTGLGLQILKSRQFFQSFVERHDVLPALMAPGSYDAQSQALLLDADLYDSTSGKWLREVQPPRQAKPSVQEAHEVFLGLLSTSQDKETGFVTLSIEHISPVVAQKWVSWLVQDINETLRAQDLEQAEKSIAYLYEQIYATSLAELRVGLFELIQSQVETMMLAKATPEYLFKTIDPAVVPELKAKPKRSLIAALGVVLGGMLGCLIVLVRHYAFTK